MNQPWQPRPRSRRRDAIVAACIFISFAGICAVGFAVDHFAAQREFEAAMAEHDAQRVRIEAIRAAVLPPVFADVDATYYGRRYAGRKTASGERFDPSLMTCATSLDIPFGTRIIVETEDASVVVRVTDRMPLNPKHPRRRLDLSAAAFEMLAPHAVGVIPVTVRVLGR